MDQSLLESMLLKQIYGAPCEFTGICIEVECEGRQAQGLGETAARNLILSESYRQNSFATDLRIREITQGNDLLDAARGGVDRTALYDRIMIQHSVPRFNNPTGTFDNDQYVIEILTQNDAGGLAARKALKSDLDQLFINCGVPVVSLGPGAVTDTLLYPPGYFDGTAGAALKTAIETATGHTVDTWDNYVAGTLDPATDCAGLSLVGAYEDTIWRLYFPNF